MTTKILTHQLSGANPAVVLYLQPIYQDHRSKSAIRIHVGMIWNATWVSFQLHLTEGVMLTGLFDDEELLAWRSLDDRSRLLGL